LQALTTIVLEEFDIVPLFVPVLPYECD